MSVVGEVCENLKISNFMKIQQTFSRRCLVTDGPPAGCVLNLTISSFLKKTKNHTLT